MKSNYVYLFIGVLIIGLKSSLAQDCKNIKLFGEIEKKSRKGKKIISQKKFVPVSAVITPNSSEFGRLSIKGLESDEMAVNYYTDLKNNIIDEKFKIKDSIVMKFNLREIEEKINTQRPGFLKLTFKNKDKVLCEKKIKFIGGD